MSVAAFSDYTELQVRRVCWSFGDGLSVGRSSSHLSLQNAYEMGLIARGEFDKQRDRLLHGQSAEPEKEAPKEAEKPVAAAAAQTPEPQQEPSDPQEDFQEGESVQ